MKGAPPLPATTNTEPAAIHPDRYREVMRHHPTGVAAVSSLDSDTGEPCGLVVGTLASLSLEPALITFSVNRSSSSWQKISRTGKFTVSLLAEGQQAVLEALSRKEDDKFAGLDWSFSAQRTPQIDRALGWIHCTINREIDGGDHWLVIADVMAMSASGGEPLIFPGGRLGGFRWQGPA
ncbi:MAG: flavin reductase family protein [Specibacter sp.]